MIAKSQLLLIEKAMVSKLIGARVQRADQSFSINAIQHPRLATICTLHLKCKREVKSPTVPLSFFQWSGRSFGRGFRFKKLRMVDKQVFATLQFLQERFPWMRYASTSSFPWSLSFSYSIPLLCNESGQLNQRRAPDSGGDESDVTSQRKLHRSENGITPSRSRLTYANDRQCNG